MCSLSLVFYYALISWNNLGRQIYILPKTSPHRLVFFIACTHFFHSLPLLKNIFWKFPEIWTKQHMRIVVMVKGEKFLALASLHIFQKCAPPLVKTFFKSRIEEDSISSQSKILPRCQISPFARFIPCSDLVGE